MAVQQLVPLHLDTLAGIINDAQTNIEYHAKSMLHEAKAAGDALIEAKKVLAHGEFKPWVEANTSIKEAMARRYMQVARKFQTDTTVAFSDLADMSIRSFLDIKDKPTTPSSTSKVFATPSITTPDLARALKLAPMAHRGEGNEKTVAAAKLTSLYRREDLLELIVQAFAENMKRCSDEDLIAILADIADGKFK